jgi:hypothetical protein
MFDQIGICHFFVFPYVKRVHFEKAHCRWLGTRMIGDFTS